MTESGDIPLFPVIGCDTGTAPRHGAVLLRLLYASPADPCHTGLMHSMTGFHGGRYLSLLLAEEGQQRVLVLDLLREQWESNCEAAKAT